MLTQKEYVALGGTRAHYKIYKANMIKEGWYQRYDIPSECGTHKVTKWVKDDMNTNQCIKHSNGYWIPADNPQVAHYLGTLKSETSTKCAGHTHAYTTPMSDKCYNPPKENEMYNKANNVTVALDVVQRPVTDGEANKVNYLSDRLNRMFYDKKSKLWGEFNLSVDNEPKSFQDLIAAIKGDKFKIDPKVQKRYEAHLAESADRNGDDDFSYESGWYYNNTYGIIWDGPQPDRKGYDKAMKDLETERNRVKDSIMVLTPAEGLAALQAFEAWTPSKETDTVH